MARTKLSNCAFVEYGYGQVEPNLLSAQRTGQIYAQLPAASSVNVLENGQFAKYDYRNGEVNFTGAGEWMLVFNEVKVYRDLQRDCDFAMVKGNYEARVYSPITGVVKDNDASIDWTSAVAAADPYEIDSTNDPMQGKIFEGPAMMKAGTTMVPRLLKTNIGDIFTTNTIDAESVALGDVLTPGENGYLKVGEGDMQWQVVKVYTMPDGQQGAKIMRIA
jgi:hypothetical protein